MIQEVVPPSGHENRGREVVPARELSVGRIVGVVEVPDVGGKAQAILQERVVEARASLGFDHSRPQRQVLPPVSEEGRDREIVFVLRRIGGVGVPFGGGRGWGGGRGGFVSLPRTHAVPLLPREGA